MKSKEINQLGAKIDSFDPSIYKISVQYREVDGHFFHVGTIFEFPDIEVYEESSQDAIEALHGILRDLFEDAKQHGRALPAPATPAKYSGRVTLRMPPWLHEQLDQRATSYGVSLNTHIITLLSDRNARTTAASAKPTFVGVSGCTANERPDVVIAKLDLGFKSAAKVLRTSYTSMASSAAESVIEFDQPTISGGDHIINSKAIGREHVH